MSKEVKWDVEWYREEHESEEHWDLRRRFMLQWKDDFEEDRLLCLARIFVNIELLGCRYPPQVMQQVARLSEEVAKGYRQKKKGMLQRTFVSASDAAEDRAKGTKRKSGVVQDDPPDKKAKINFVPQGFVQNTEVKNIPSDKSDDEELTTEEKKLNEQTTSEKEDVNEYLNEMLSVKCLDIRTFNESMFDSPFGRFVLLIRPWTSKLGNIHASCAVCKLQQIGNYINGTFTLEINNQLIASAQGATKAEARSQVETVAWNRLRTECVVLFVREQWIARDNSRITSDDVTAPAADQFGAPIESSVATKMMKMMGWAGGGLGADAQGIAEPIKPHLQMVNRQGLGSGSSDIRSLKRAADSLMRRYQSSDCLDVDLVFSADFGKEERAALHQIAKRAGLASTSYGRDEDRFLVVKKKLDPFSLVRAVLQKGGTTPKYQVFLPAALRR